MLLLYNFTNIHRLKKTDEFSSVFKFRKIKSGCFLKIYFKPNSLSHSRIGLIVSKRISKFANRRNYMKRTIRELFRKNQPKWIGYDIIVRAEKYFTKDDFIKVIQEFEFLTKHLKR